MTKLLVALSAKTWQPTSSRHMDQSRRNQIGAALRLLADRIQQGASGGILSGPEIETSFRLEQSPAADTADEAA
jgi:hypothetical protein